MLIKPEAQPTSALHIACPPPVHRQHRILCFGGGRLGTGEMLHLEPWSIVPGTPCLVLPTLVLSR